MTRGPAGNPRERLFVPGGFFHFSLRRFRSALRQGTARPLSPAILPIRPRLQGKVQQHLKDALPLRKFHRAAVFPHHAPDAFRADPVIVRIGLAGQQPPARAPNRTGAWIFHPQNQHSFVRPEAHRNPSAGRRQSRRLPWRCFRPSAKPGSPQHPQLWILRLLPRVSAGRRPWPSGSGRLIRRISGKEDLYVNCSVAPQSLSDGQSPL